MPANKNALIRYKTIDNCLRNRYRRWTLDDLVEACSDALYDMEGITKGVCARTIQMDIQIMRSENWAIMLLSKFMIEYTTDTLILTIRSLKCLYP